MPSLFSRHSQAARTLFGREERNVPVSESMYYGGMGMPATFKPEESQKAYGDNVWLYRAVFTSSMELASINLRLQSKNAKGEVTPIETHQALDVLARPQPIKGGKSMLTSMDLKLLCGMHMMLNGEAFWLLDKRLSATYCGAPTFVQPLMPQAVTSDIGEDGTLSRADQLEPLVEAEPSILNLSFEGVRA